MHMYNVVFIITQNRVSEVIRHAGAIQIRLLLLLLLLLLSRKDTNEVRKFNILQKL